MLKLVEGAPPEDKATEASLPLQEKAEALPELKAAYSVALYDSGELDFRLGGKNPGLVEILGLHIYATKQLDALLEGKIGLGHQRTWEILQRFSPSREPPITNTLKKTER